MTTTESNKKIKLTPVQENVMKWLGKSWIAYPHVGVSYYVNGKRLCMLATLQALEKAGLLKKVEHNGYTATEAGRQLTQERGL